MEVVNTEYDNPLFNSFQENQKRKKKDFPNPDKIVTKDNDIDDRLDCLGKNLANLRSDIPDLVREAVKDAVIQFFKERDKPKKYVEVGYRG